MFDVLKLRKRVTELEEEMMKLTRIVQARDLDWEDMRARCKRLLDRTEKAARAVVESEHSSGEDPVAEGPVTQDSGNGSFLTPHQLAMQQKILRQRAGRG